MDYNLAAVRQRVLIDKLDDEEFDPDVVDRFINDTQRSIFAKYELSFMEKIFSGTIPSGSISFKMPADVALVQSRTVTGPDGFERDLKPSYMPFRDFNRTYPTPSNNQPGIISRWTLYGNNMMTSTPTDVDYQMNLFYIKKPAKLTQDAQVPDIPEEFEELLVLGAFMRIQQRNEDFDLAQQTKAEYTDILTDMVNKYGFREADGPIIMGQPNRRYGNTRSSLVRKSY